MKAPDLKIPWNTFDGMEVRAPHERELLQKMFSTKPTDRHSALFLCEMLHQTDMMRDEPDGPERSMQSLFVEAVYKGALLMLNEAKAADYDRLLNEWK